MPEISRFLGIVIGMYYNDHAPPHFHAKYSGEDVIIHIADTSKGSFLREHSTSFWNGIICIVMNWPRTGKD